MSLENVAFMCPSCDYIARVRVVILYKNGAQRRFTHASFFSHPIVVHHTAKEIKPILKSKGQYLDKFTPNIVNYSTMCCCYSICQKKFIFFRKILGFHRNHRIDFSHLRWGSQKKHPKNDTWDVAI